MSATTRLGAATIVLIVLVAAPAAAQTANLRPFMGQTTFSPQDQADITSALGRDLTDLAEGTSDDDVTRARNNLVDVAMDNQATEAFRTAVAEIIVRRIDARLPQILTHRNRLNTAIVVARLQTPQTLPLLLKLLGEDESRQEHYPSVRYWAAQALATEQMRSVIRSESAGVPQRVSIERLSGALQRETDPIVAGALIGALATIQTEAATDALVSAVASKAVQFDLGSQEAVDAMRTATAALADAYERELRPAGEGKQPIVAALAQALVQTPPTGAGLGLIVDLDQTLTSLTGIQGELDEAVKALQGRTRPEDPKLVDLVWLHQLNWVEVLLQREGDVRLLKRPTVLQWTPQKSAEAIRAMQKQGT